MSVTSRAGSLGRTSHALAHSESNGPGVRVALFLVGFAPIGLLALSLLEVVPLHLGGPIGLSAALLSTFWLVVRSPWCRPLVVRGLVSGFIAVLIYDGTRMPFVILGGWPDFIPKIGAWLLNTPNAHWGIGYAWRYLGNGAGMGLGFVVVAPFLVRLVGRRWAGCFFGVMVWSGLLATVVIAPNGQTKMFALTPATFVLSLLGHLVYGGVLGLLIVFRSDRHPWPHGPTRESEERVVEGRLKIYR